MRHALQGHARRAWWACCAVLMIAGWSASCGGGGGGDVIEPPGTEVSCASHLDCGVTEFCSADEVCVSAGACGSPSAWTSCVDRVERADAEHANRYVCMVDACTRLCVADVDCAGEDESCSDFGRCVAYDGEQLPYDSGDYSAGALRAGVGEAILNVPIGVEMGGYGSRAKQNDGRFARSLSASQGQMDAQYARAVVLDNGINRLLLMRAPVVFSFDQLHERIARNLQDATGHDWRDELILSATHTHSGPASFWRLPPDNAIDPGMLGAGAFFQQIEDWLVDSLTEAALEAIDNLQPAKFAWKISEAFDIDDHVGRDRWSATPPFDMNRLLLMRVDDADDVPMAVLFSYGAHGTDNSGDYMTDDVIGGAERGLSAALSEEFGRFIPTLYFAENGGNMSPGAGRQGHRFPHSRERAGYVLAEKAMPVLLAMVPEENIAFRSRNYRFNINYHAIGYEDGEFAGAGGRPLGGSYFNGALMCGGPDADDDDYATFISPNRLSCVSLAFILNNFQPSPLTRTQIMAVELDGLSLITLPGEPTQHIGWQVMRSLRDNLERPTSQTWVFGYTNDHLLYLVPTNLRGESPDVAGFVADAPDSYPDYAFSFLQGGYEPGMAPWGPLFGDWLIERATEAFAWLQDDTAVPTAHPPVLPAQYTRVEQPAFAWDETPEALVGTVLEQVPATVKRMQSISFSWIGGDSGAEAPQAPLVTLESEDDGEWLPVVGPDHLEVNNRGLAMATRVKIVDDGGQSRYHWTVYWESTKDLYRGEYRFSIKGHRYDAAGERVPYTLTSDVFELKPNDELVIDMAWDPVNHQLVGTVSYPLMTPFEQNTDGERAKLSGSLRLRDPRVPSALHAPLEFGRDLSPAGVIIDWVDGGVANPQNCATCQIETVLETVDGYDGVPQTKIIADAPSPGATVEKVSVADAYGNYGNLSF